MDDNICYEFIDLIPQNVPYKYEPIEPGWIRILDLLNEPGDNGPLQCRLRQVRLPQSKVRNTEDDYNALSYVWGCDRQRFEMQVLPAGNGYGPSTTTGKMPLTRSLYNALRDLRDCDDIQPKTFWIDQICIDQGSDEKSHQVSQLGKVFQHATSVWTYLGPREDTDDEALDLMAQICEHFESESRTHPELARVLEDLRDQWYMSENFGKYTRQSAENIEYDIWFPKNLFEGEGSILYSNLRKILFGPWVNRLWLFQENVLNDDLTFFRGHQMLRFDAIRLICQLSWVGLIPFFPGVYNILNVFQQRLARRHPDENQWGLLLQNLIRTTCRLACRDPRDRIYAVLGIATDAEEMKIYPDYSISTAQAFTNLSVTFTKQRLEGGSRFFLEELHRKDVQMPAKQPYSCLPTWVPKYLDNGYLRPRGTDFDLFKTTKKESRRTLKDAVSFESSPVAKNGVMVVKGIRLELHLDRSLGTFSGATVTFDIDMQELNQTLAILEKFIEYANGSQRLLSHFWEACALGCRILDTTIDSAIGEAAAAQAFCDVLQLLKEARSGVVAPSKNSKDRFWLPILALPGGQKGPAYLLLDAMETLASRSLWLSKEQHVCVAPNQLHKDDVAVIMFGGQYIYYLRPAGDKYEYVGWGWILGFMNGEAFVDGREDKVETFKLI